MARQATSFSALVKQVLSKPFSRFSDSFLLDRFVDRGDELAFGAIVDRHGPMLLSLCRRHVGDAHLAEDVLQATFLLLVRKAPSIRKRDSLAGWLHGVAQRLGRQARLSDAARSRRERQAAEARAETTAGDPAWDDLLRAVDEELKRLPERHRLPLLLCYLEGRTQDEAARQLGWSLSTLRRRLEEGRDLLKTRLIRHGTTLEAGLFAGFLAPSAVRTVLTREVRQAVINTAMASSQGVAVSTSVLVLANGAMRMSLIAKLLLCAAGVTVACATVAGAVWQLGAGTPAVESRLPPRVQTADVKTVVPQPAQNKEPLPGHDLFNDPLPKGAVARLGTVAFRHGRVFGSGSLTFTQDGKQLISTGGGWLRRWDVATGRALLNLGEDWRGTFPFPERHLVAADGKLAIAVRSPKGPGQNWPVTEVDLETGKSRASFLEFAENKAGPFLDPPSHISPDGKTLFRLLKMGTKGGPITVWNTADGKITQFFQAQNGGYLGLAIPPAGKTIVVGDNSHTIRVFDLSTGKEQRSFGVPQGSEVRLMVVSPDGKMLVTTSSQSNKPGDPFLWLWDLEKGVLRSKIDIPKNKPVKSLVFTPNGEKLIGSGGRAISTWKVSTGELGLAWDTKGSFDDTSVAITVTPDGKVLATMGGNGVIRLWDMATGQETELKSTNPFAIHSVSFSPDGATIATLGQDSGFRQWDAKNGRMVGLARVFDKKVESLWAGGSLILAGFPKDKTTDAFRLYESASGKILLEGQGRPVISMDGKRAAVRTKGDITVFDTETQKPIRVLAQPKPTPGLLVNVQYMPWAFTPDGQFLIVQGETVDIWDLQSGTKKSSWGLVERKILDSTSKSGRFGGTWTLENMEARAISPDGSRVAFAVRKPRDAKKQMFVQLTVLESATGKVLHRTDLSVGPTDFQVTLAFSPDGTRLALGGPWTISVWELGTDKAGWEFEGHRGPVTALAFSPDGKRLVSASEDSTALVWDLTK